MESTRDERFEEIKKNWFDVMTNYYRDMAATTSEPEARAVEDNYHRAEAAFLDGLAAGLDRNGSAVEQAFSGLRDANDAIAEARAAVVAFVDLLQRLQSATKLAVRLLALAA